MIGVKHQVYIIVRLIGHLITYKQRDIIHIIISKLVVLTVYWTKTGWMEPQQRKRKKNAKRKMMLKMIGSVQLWDEINQYKLARLLDQYFCHISVCNSDQLSSSCYFSGFSFLTLRHAPATVTHYQTLLTRSKRESKERHACGNNFWCKVAYWA